MLSGNGRHRRPRQAPAFLVAAGVTSASVALPLLGTGAAQAVTGSTWDRVAECESDGLWSADKGNGYYGGFQLPLSLWLEFGGEDFADRPDLASRSQQIAVAERILAEQGPGAFPACGLSTGLSREHLAERDGGLAGGDDSGSAEESGGLPVAGDTPPAPDVLDVPKKADPSDASDMPDVSDGSGLPQGVTPGPDTPEADTSPRIADPDGGAGSDGSGGKHRGEQTAEEAGGSGAAQAPGDAEASRESREGSRGKGRDGALGYQVRHGDTLTAIATERQLDGGWTALYQANESVIGDNPDHILPGQRLDLDLTD